jgi:aspartate beta-hydroxylase
MLSSFVGVTVNSQNEDPRIVELDRALAVDPRNVRALIARADHFATTGDARAAGAFYRAALKASPARDRLPPDLVRELQRAHRMCEQIEAGYKSYVREKLAARGFDPDRASSARFAQSLAIAFGEKRTFLQQPRYFYFPELPQIQFYDREQFAWIPEVEAETTRIRDELLGVMRDPAAFSPYVTGEANRPRNDQQGMLNNPAWSAFFLWKNGEPVPGNAERCPATMRALERLPLARVPNRSPSILFSLMQPRAHIPPHNGLVNTRLICHLPLIVPGGCRFRVGNEVREWQQGRCWLFDDTIEHEAWNDSDETRVILLFDVWRPELSHEERQLLQHLFESIDAYNGTRPHWEI